MPETFYTILTAIGLAKLSNSVASGIPVNITTVKAGDGNGVYYSPSESQLDLVNTVWTGNANSVSIDPNNANWFVVESYIPADVGDFYVREVGCFDSDGDLIAIGKYPETYKPNLAAGSGKDMYLRIITEATNAAQVSLVVDPAIVMASKQYVDSKLRLTWTVTAVDYTASPGELVMADFTAGALTIKLPPTPADDDRVEICDAKKALTDTNKLTVDRNGSNIQGLAENLNIDGQWKGITISLSYKAAVGGWIIV